MAQTLLLDAVNWDLTVDRNGNIAVASEPYALAQDVASASKLFQGELWFDNTQGLPYFPEILGALPPLALLKQLYQEAALSVPDVISAELFVSGIDETRALSGQIQIRSSTGIVVTALLFPQSIQAFNAISPTQPGSPTNPTKPPSSFPFTLGQSTLGGGNILG